MGLLIRRIKYRLFNDRYFHKTAFILLVVFFLCIFGIQGLLVNIIKKLFGVRDDTTFFEAENSHKPLHYDDSKVNTSNYIDEYIEHLNYLSDLVKARNHKKIAYKHIINAGRPPSFIHKKEFLILQYTPIFGSNKLCENRKPSDMYLKECPFTNCHFSCDIQDSWKADALIFSEWDLHDYNAEASLEVKKLRHMKSFHLDAIGMHRINQIWILWNDEPNISRKMSNYAFNWTMSYRHDSEISDCAYGCAYSKTNTVESNFESFVQELEIEFNKRKIQAVWAVSNCKSKRIKYALELSQVFPVKVLGRCAHHFSRQESSEPFLVQMYKKSIGLFKSDACGRESECERELFDRSQFYLSFESRNCSDYITEKFWRVLRTGMIPVVLQPSKAAYARVAPPDSFIHAEDFDFDMVKLAVYLNKVSTVFETYIRHHKWKLDYDVVYAAAQTEKRRMCELCIKMNQETNKVYYTDVPKWFDSECHN